MIVKSYYRTQRDLAVAINKLVDLYWANQLDEKILIKSINCIYSNNKGMIYKGNQFTKILQQNCGKKRLDILQKIISIY